MDVDALVGITGVALALFGAVFGLYRYTKSYGRLSVSANVGNAVNSDGVGTHLCALLTISNSGGAVVYYGGVQALDQSGELYYPFATLMPQAKLEPGEYIQGTIPAGHLLKPRAKKLWVLDGNGRKYSMGKKSFAELMCNLGEESERLAALDGVKDRGKEIER